MFRSPPPQFSKVYNLTLGLFQCCALLRYVPVRACDYRDTNQLPYPPEVLQGYLIQELFLLPGDILHILFWQCGSLVLPHKSVPGPLRTETPFKTSASTSMSCFSVGQGLSVVKCLFIVNLVQSPWAVTIWA